MKTSVNHSPNWNELVFENRNKAYGAFQLREQYARQVLKALLAAVLMILLVVFLPSLVQLFEKEEKKPVLLAKTINYTELAAPPPIEQTPPPQAATPPPVKKVIKYLPPKVTEEEVQEEEPMPTVEEIQQNNTGLENIEGTGEVVMDLPVEGDGQVAAAPEEVYQFVEQMPEFDGGMEALAQFLQKNLKYPATARRMGIEGTVFVKFVVGEDGEVEKVEVMKGIVKDCDEEAARVISKMPAWKPGKQNNKQVKVSMMLPIKFKLA
ncbi:energy transducer TonB [Catalinimonas sp. 4WD22]|uniref:energy transducer TonB n=1 Tax=Catalinimonas locisalis TaxID=3133978 RepID=UPI003100F21F